MIIQYFAIKCHKFLMNFDIVKSYIYIYIYKSYKDAIIPKFCNSFYHKNV